MTFVELDEDCFMLPIWSASLRDILKHSIFSTYEGPRGQGAKEIGGGVKDHTRCADKVVRRRDKRAPASGKSGSLTF